MRPQRSRLVALVGAAALVAPAGAWAQGAVDEQYRDPFAGQGDGGSEQPDTGQSAPSATPASPPAAGDPAASPAPTGTTASTPGSLPRTGLPAALVALAGGALVAAGATLRRRVR